MQRSDQARGLARVSRTQADTVITGPRIEEIEAVAHLGSYLLDLATGRWASSSGLDAIFGIDQAFDRSVSGWVSLIHPDERAEMDAYLADDVVGSRRPFDREYRIIRRDTGDVRWVHGRGRLELDDAGRPCQMLGTIIDITEQHAAHEALARSEARYESIFEGTTEAIVIAEQATLRIRYVNAAATALLGYPRDELHALTVRDIHPADVAPAIATQFRATSAGSRVSPAVPCRRKDGTVVLADVKASPVEIDGVACILGFFSDVTERERAEAERSRLLGAIDQATDSVVIFDPGGRVAYVNAAFEQATGLARRELVGHHPDAMEIILGVNPGNPELRAALDAGGTWSTKASRSTQRAGEIDVVVTQVRDERGAPTGTVAIGRDMTRERALEGQLRQAQKMEVVGQLAGGIAHDFNNLLTAIRGYGELVAAGLAADDARRADADEVVAAADRAAELTRQLLAFSRRQMLMPRVLDPASSVASIVPMLRRLLGEHIAISVRAVPGAGSVLVDPTQFDQVVVNLAVNARDAMPDGGTLTIETAVVELDADYVATHVDAMPGSHVALSVTDTGSGMDPATMARAFEPFFTTKEPGKGTGMGLATVHGIVRQSGGSIEVYSEPGRGTTFRVYLPRVPEGGSPAGVPEPAVDPLPTGRETVLLVEDEAAIRRLATRVLEAQGYTVLAASDAVEAVEIASEHRGAPDLLVTDVVMPGWQGPELARQLAATYPDLRVLFMSGFTELAVMRDLAPKAGSGFLSKPFTTEALAWAVRNVLDGKDIGRETRLKWDAGARPDHGDVAP